jgi:RNA polymerase sigma-70 factor (ECF subfamily)
MEQSRLMSEIDLIARLQAPATQERAFAEVVGAYQEQLYWHVRRMVGDHDEADDVLQNSFVKAWRSISGFRGESKLKTWLYRIATNEALTALEKIKKRSFSDVEDLADDLRHSHSGGMQLSGDEIQARLDAAVETLPPKQKQVFVMKYHDELTYEEMAAVLGGTVGSLKASFHHAAKKIEQQLLSH